MRLRRRLAAGTIALVGAASWLMAPAATAATHHYTADCVAGQLIPATQIIADPGDTIVVDGIDCDWNVTNDVAVSYFASTPESRTLGAGPYTWVLRSDLPAGQYGSQSSLQFGVYKFGSVCQDGFFYCGTLYYFTIRDQSQPIPDWVQSYGRGSESEKCQDGWNASWEQWPNGNTGGFVCTRSIPSLGEQG